MTQSIASQPGSLPESVRAEAAAWIARLHGPDRTAADEQSFRRWLAADAVHAAAFERMTELWETGTRLKSDVLGRVQQSTPKSPRTYLPIAVAAASIMLIAAGALLFLRDTAEVTRVGEQRILTLDDGTRVTMNTATRLEVRYDKARRAVELTTGEAFFEVAQRRDRPFVVLAGGRRITALGTSFVVRQDIDRLSVTLMDGKVSISPGRVQYLAPGERLTLASSATPKLDRPAIDQVTGWRRGVIALDNTSLAEAVAEMNRYSTVQLAIEGVQAGRIHVSGMFRAGDSVEFARALARTHGLHTMQENNRIVLSQPEGDSPP